jgi:glucans biosynthesis protein
MNSERGAPGAVSRRALLATAPATAALILADGILRHLPAQTGTGADAATQQFSFDILTAQMRERAAAPYEPAPRIGGVLAGLTYDDHRNIAFRHDRARWREAGTRFQLHAFHPGWLFDEPVQLFEVTDGMARPIAFSGADFEYRQGLDARIPPGFALEGIAGFRMSYPLNRPDYRDELVAFLGASYFRALGRGSAYGLSARGLAIDTAVGSGAEEFPRFSAFYLERPAADAGRITLCAALDSPRVTGAYRFDITPGPETVIEVTARLFFRDSVEELGIAPLTSMFLFAEKNRAGFDDYRPNVHDSNGLSIRRADGDVLWRPLNNPATLAGSYFAEVSPRAFGLEQRERDFENFQDAEARYERRPSAIVEPLGDWGPGAVRLVEIPTDLEVNDNIVAFWVPATPVAAGDAREFAYRLRWGDLPPADGGGDLAWVHETRSGAGGVSGVESRDGLRKFVVDFAGGLLAALDGGAPVEAVVSAGEAEIASVTLERLAGRDRWRMVIDVAAEAGATVELSAHVAGFGRKLSEIWLYQWINR